MAKIITYDSTLRDGEQSEGVTLSLEDKLRIARRLDAFGIDIIEGGFPASNPKDIAFFRELRERPLTHARIAAFGSTCKKGADAAQDPGLADLVASGAPVVGIVGKTWDTQVELALQTTLDENLRMIGDSVAFLKSHGLEVVFDAEHFFDGYRANPDYALACIGAAARAGADSVDLCDTNGGTLPFEIEETVRVVGAYLDGLFCGESAADKAGGEKPDQEVDVKKPDQIVDCKKPVQAMDVADGSTLADAVGPAIEGEEGDAVASAAAFGSPGGAAAAAKTDTGFSSANARTRIGIHCHNDGGCAVANTLSAVRAGATQVQGTINGYGERVGNADLLTVIADLELKMGHECVGAESLRQLTSVAGYVAEICNFSVWAHAPYVGSSAFAHKGGLHASAISRFEHAYDHISPDAVGNSARMVVSELAGKASLLAKAASLGYDLADKPEQVQMILDQVKAYEAQGHSYEVADGSLSLLILRSLGRYEPYFTLESFRVIVDDREDTGAHAKDAQSEATIKIHVGDKRYVATGEGVGPVGALDNALRMALAESYPQVNDMELIDFKVRLLDESTGTNAITRVVITSRDSEGDWGTIGVSENIIEASWNALVESFEYGLMRIGA